MYVTIVNRAGSRFRMRLVLLATVLTFICFGCMGQVQAAQPAQAAGESVWIGRFDPGERSLPPSWQVIQVNRRVPATEYRVRVWDGVPSIEAVADRSMALLAREVTIDLEKTPILCWKWRIDNVIATADMKRKTGDDYAARIYVAFSLPPQSMDLMTRLTLQAGRRLFGQALPDAAINYVWDNRYPEETALPNAYTDRVRMIVVQSGDAQRAQWVTEQRDVARDFAAQFGATTPRISSIAIATDTDNTQTMAHAGFADIRFVPRGTRCSPGK